MLGLGNVLWQRLNRQVDDEVATGLEVGAVEHPVHHSLLLQFDVRFNRWCVFLVSRHVVLRNHVVGQGRCCVILCTGAANPTCFFNICFLLFSTCSFVDCFVLLSLTVFWSFSMISLILRTCFLL